MLGHAFGQAVRTIRSRQGLSQEKLAELAGLDRTYISGLERGRRNPALSTVEKVAGALGVRPLALFEVADRTRADERG